MELPGAEQSQKRNQKNGPTNLSAFEAVDCQA
jgi:hypothetical protein